MMTMAQFSRPADFPDGADFCSFLSVSSVKSAVKTFRLRLRCSAFFASFVVKIHVSGGNHFCPVFDGSVLRFPFVFKGFRRNGYRLPVHASIPAPFNSHSLRLLRLVTGDVTGLIAE